MAGGQSRARAARTDAPKKDKDAVRSDNVAPGTHPDAVAGPARTQAEIDAERRRVQPHQVSGPGSGSKLLTAPERDLESGELSDQEEIGDVSELLSTDDSTAMVTVGKDVYEEIPAPGAPGRTIQQLLFHKGQVVRKSVLDRHIAAQRKAAKADGDAGDDGEGDGGETK